MEEMIWKADIIKDFWMINKIVGPFMVQMKKRKKKLEDRGKKK